MNENEFDNHLKKAFVLQERKALKKHLQDIEQNINVPKKTNWLLVASIALIIGFAGYYFLINQQPTNQELFYAYYKPYENVESPIVRNKSTKTPKQKAFTFYDNQEFTKAIVAFKNLTDLTDDEKTSINFYTAIAYIEKNELNQAKPLLLDIVSKKNKDWEKESLWYLALVELKLNNKKNVIYYLNQLQKFKTNYKKREASELLNKMNN